jgi:hypothetical protein
MVYIEPNYNIVDRRCIIIGGDSEYRSEDVLDSKAVGNKPYFGLLPYLLNKKRPRACPHGFKVIQYEKVRNAFRFPPGHPVKDMAYAVCDIEPDLYIPVSEFHEYFQKMKHASFIQLCANLGAKEIIVDDIYIDKKKADLSVSVPEPIANIGVTYRKERGLYIEITFSENNKKIKQFDSPWIDTEPTWKAMVDMRKENALNTYKCDYNYSEDFGINAKLAASAEKHNINIGGSFTSMKKIHIKYDVVFW